MNTPLRMTKDDVRASVAGYDEAATTEAFERMFERDKDSLRALGVPIVTVDSGGHAQDVGYRIDKDAYALEEVDLTPAELGVLSLAAQFWQDSAVAVDTTRALTKLRSAGESAELGEAADAVAGLAPQVRSVSDAYETLLDAVVERRAVTFTYRAASTGQVLRRTVEPWRVVVRDGGWYLLGHDQDRRAARAFKPKSTGRKRREHQRRSQDRLLSISRFSKTSGNSSWRVRKRCSITWIRFPNLATC